MTFSPAAALRSALVSPVLLRERLRSGVVYNPLSADMARNPYPHYAALRARDPVHRSLLVNGWVFTRHADIDAILRDHRHFSNDPRQGTLSARQQRRLPASEEFTLIFLDPPDHTRLRALVNKAFARNAIAAIESRIRTILGSLLDDIADPSGFDLMTAIAQPLPVIVVAEMLGVPAEDRDRFKIWSARRARLLEPTIGRRERRLGAAAMIAFDAYFREIIAERRKTPRGDIVSALAQVEEDGERLNEREMLNMLRLLLIAGNETTTNLIGNGILALLRNPDQLQRLRDDPTLIPGAVEELLRFDSPVQANFRHVLADCTINDIPLQRRDNLLLLLGSANRDPDAFEDPDRLDVGRGSSSHLSLGRGIHHCLGAGLARLEGRLVLEMLLERFASIRLLDDRTRFRTGIVFRGLHSLPLCCTPA
ncbi:MAG: cytochrome P450 [Boseongicola sp. SB0677_bin_26]|nr:cytochrome P450 [Boseongicola sp. SB0665_bin_10]MYG27466.1 cytochrome P450 [Boseongicola sp. SB0677_bin_26]